MMTPERCEIIDGSRARSRRTAGIRFWVQFLEPLGVIERRESTARRAGAAEHVDEDVDAAELLQHRPGRPR